MPSIKCLIFVVTVSILRFNCVHAGVSSGYETPDSCKRETKNDCQTIGLEKGRTSPTCFGVNLPYTDTSNELINANFTHNHIRNELKRWEEGLKSLPRCWAVVQPLLCSFYLPKCVDKKIELPSQELCKISRNPCRVIEESLKEWPDFLKCENFVPNCKNTEIMRDLPFNTSAQCSYPMIGVENAKAYYEGFDGCALQCKDHLFTEQEHETVSKTVKYLGFGCLAAVASVILTYIMDWRSSNVYPSVIIMYANVCYFVAICGWMLQFLPQAKDDIVCRKDSTIRRREYDSNENVFCSLVFVLIYFGSMAALAWLVVFAYVWNLTCSAVGRIRERIDKKSVYFHFFCWLIPLVLTIVCMSLSAIEGNYLSGVCYVSYTDSTYRITLVILPVTLAAAVMLMYFWRGLVRLWSVSMSSSDYISSFGRAAIQSNAIRVAVFTAGTVAVVVAFVVLQVHEIQWRPVWDKSSRDFLVCNLNLTTVAECEVGEKPTMGFVMWNNAMFFIGGLLVSSWAWTGASVRTWRRFVTKRFKSENSLDQPQHRVQKHKLIAQAFAKRHQLPGGRLSLNLQSSHEDPVGLNGLLDPKHLCRDGDTELRTQNNTETGEENTSEWAAALPQLLTRRGAIAIPHSSVSCMSADNDSRRPSCDSAMSEFTVTTRHLGTPYEEKKSKRRFFNRFNRSSRHRRGNNTTGSSTSLESNHGSQILPIINALIDKRNRRHDDESLMPLNNTPATAPTSRRPIIMKELAVQTSLEKLGSSGTIPNTFGVKGKNCNLSSNLTAEKGTQYSLTNVNEVGTQTKKSATKKKTNDKGSGKDGAKKTDKDGKESKDENKDEQEDPVLKLLTPN